MNRHQKGKYHVTDISCTKEQRHRVDSTKKLNIHRNRESCGRSRASSSTGKSIHHVSKAAHENDKVRSKLCCVSTLQREDTRSNARWYRLLGVQTSTWFLSNCFWWPSLRRDVSAFVGTCHMCQLKSEKIHY